jgi:GTP cyclohydrolase IA
MQQNVINFLHFIGEDPNRPGLVDTPLRVVNMWIDMFYGYDKSKEPTVTLIDNGEDGILYNDLLIDNGYFFSHCEHHIIPFFGTFHLGYIPDKYLIGISKIDRIVDYCAARLQVAERLVHDICDMFEKHVKPKGMMLVMSGRHLCKEMRGVKKFNSPFEVSAVRGCFLSNELNCKGEFLERIR